MKMNEFIPERTREIGKFIEERFVDENGTVYSLIDKKTRLPAEESFFPDAGPEKEMMDFFVESYTRSEFVSYENCGMCTGAYMQSLLYRHRVLNDPESLEMARRCFGALKRIFEIGKQFEVGFFPKIYGNRFSCQTSTDQVLYSIVAMDHFYEFASCAERDEIDQMIPQMVGFWVRRNYKYTYFNLKDMQWPLVRFPSFLLLAYKHSGDSLFQKEYERLQSEGFTSEPQYAQLKAKKEDNQPSEYEKKHNAWLIENMADCMTMDTMNLDCLLSLDSGNPLAGKWKNSMLLMWDEAKITLASNGKYYVQILVDMDTGELRRPEGYGKAGSGIHGAESGWSTMVARGAVTVAKYYPGNLEIKKAVVKVLSSFSPDDFTYYDEPERFSPRYRFKTQFLSGDSITNWLWAYWQGRHQGLLN